MANILVCKSGELRDGDVRIVEVEGTSVGIYRFAGQYFAYRNVCPHQGGPACEGITMSKVVDLIAPDRTFMGQRFEDSEPHIVCPWHGWEFRLHTGECVPDPSLRLKRYDVVERDEGLYLVL